MRLSTIESRDSSGAIAVIHAALNAGVTLLDTADAYCLNDSETGHNERLIAQALQAWSGDTGTITVASKGGLVRRQGRWLPDGRARHLRAACTASLQALNVASFDLYQLHAVDPKVPIETSVRALAALQQEGLIRQIGLCNVNVGQIQAAQKVAPIASVQIPLSVFDQENVRNGVVAYCVEQGIRIIAYRPLGGAARAGRLSHDPLLAEISRDYEVSAQDLAIAWLLSLAPDVVPIPGATREVTAGSLGKALAVQLDDEDRLRLNARFGASPPPTPSRLRAPASHRAAAEIVMLMGLPAAGKSSVATEFVGRGYRRLNRDETGGRLADLVPELEAGINSGVLRWVLDNTYASRAARNRIIECASKHNIGVRCVRLTTSLAEAQINAVCRLLEAHGKLPMPEELRARSRKDHRFFGPDAQFRYERQLEPPVVEEGFENIEDRTFVREPFAGFTQQAVVFAYDDVLCVSKTGKPAALVPEDIELRAGARELAERYAAAGYRLHAVAWRPQVNEDSVSHEMVRECFARTAELLGTEIECDYCPHPAGPPVCWCRKPLPGLVLQFAFRHRLALQRSILIGRSKADRTLALRLGMQFSPGDA